MAFAARPCSGAGEMLQHNIKVWHMLVVVIPLLCGIAVIRSHDHGRCDALHAVHFQEASAVLSETRLPKGRDETLEQHFTPRLHFDPNTKDPVRAIETELQSSLNPCRNGVRLDLTFGQNEEDRFAWNHFFYKQQGGVFLELGGLDGCTFSNTIMFEYYLGWRGVLIEPGPTNYAKMVANRPEAACVNAAICSSRGMVHFVERGAVSGIVEFMTPEYMEKWHPGLQIEGVPTISCLPLRTVLKHLGVRHISFWSLDVEGGELEVLKTFDFDEVHVDVIVMEAFEDNSERNNATSAKLQSHGFFLYGHGARHNHWWVHQDFVPSKCEKDCS